MWPPAEDLYRLAPELVLSLFGMLIMLIDPFVPQQHKGGLAHLGLVGAALSVVATKLSANHPGTAFYGLMVTDHFAIYFHLIVCGVAVVAILGSREYLDREGLERGEYYALVLFATAGMGVMAGTQELVTAFIGLEISSIGSYILASFRRDVPKSHESAMKYFLLGSFATAFFLYGIALVYGATGSTQLPLVATAIGTALANPILLRLGLGMIFVGLAFKVAVVPFQLWAPDVYEGAPTPVTALLSAGPKVAAFALLLRIFAGVSPSDRLWFWAMWIPAALTMFVGNLAALVQNNVKRMLAYSSIAHAGYILVAFSARNEIGMAAVLFYLAAYTLMKMGAFTVVAHLGGEGEHHLDINDYAGLGERQPFAAACMTLYLLSLLGLPATAGFLGKFYVFKAAVVGAKETGVAGIESALLWLVILMAINTVIGAYYYLRIIVVMYMRPSQGDWTPAPMSLSTSAVLVLTALGTLYLGFFPNWVMGWASQSASLFPR